MRQKIFAVMGATGHIGHVVAEELIKRGHTVRAIGRNKSKLHQLEQKGAQALEADFDDASGLAVAFKDAYAVFTLIPPSSSEDNYGAYQDRVSEAICAAIEQAGSKRVVNLSSVGAQFIDGTGPIKGLYRHEKRLDRLNNLEVLIHLRPEFFMENLEGFIPMIKNQGVIRSPLEQNLPIPMVATRDIGWKAADFMDSTAPLGHMVFEFGGPKEVQMTQVVQVFGMVFDHPDLWYDEITYDQARKEMVASGMKPDLVNLLLEMYEGFNSGRIIPTQELKPSHRGTTTLEEYAQMLAHKLFASANVRA